MATLDSPIPLRLQRRLNRWLLRWGTPALSKSLRVEYSPRLTRAFGRCYLDRGLIRLTPSLQRAQSFLLPEILCHEAAHAAVYFRYGSAAQPHGEEWETMMRMAGFAPRVRIPVAVRRPNRGGRAKPALWLHRCPVCERSRRATRPMRTWRCSNCSFTRSGGRLVIRRAVGSTAKVGTSRTRSPGPRDRPGSGNASTVRRQAPAPRKSAATGRAR